MTLKKGVNGVSEAYQKYVSSLRDASKKASPTLKPNDEVMGKLDAASQTDYVGGKTNAASQTNIPVKHPEGSAEK